jgi:alkanesulfonate monooxygenase SsuD/methylene tetrahydromethanopterin reductase-like flavin-dependent oxidoreductase (luciferase family)
MAAVKPNPMFGPNPFKLGVFSVNADGGIALTTVPERWRADWDDIAAVARMADAAGIEFILPIARWKGFGGETDARGRSFETLTHAAALSGLTSDITIFATVHAPLVHPAFAAKALATIDHASHGRAGLNIVCGWNQPEFDMFGVGQADDRYAQGLEWYEVFSRILEGGEPFDYRGRYFDLEGVVGAPSTVQQPRPVTMSAAFSDAGRDFAARTSDFLFTTFAEIESGARHIADIRARGQAVGRELGVFTTTHVVVRESAAEAEDYYQRYAVTLADHGAVANHMRMKKEFAHSHDPHVFDLYAKRFAGGVGTYPLVGTPRQVVEEMARMHAIGFAGTTVSFVNFKDELPFFISHVLPLMEEAGLRLPAGRR